LSNADIADQLLNSSLFKNIAKSDIEALIKVMQHEHYDQGHLIFSKSDQGDTMYYILKGSIRIFVKDEKGNELTITYYREHQVFGELSLLDGQVRSASADAAEEIEVLILSRDGFLKFLEDRPSVGLVMIRDLTSRVRYTTQYLEKVLDSIHWLSKGEYDRAIQELTKSSAESAIQKLITTFVEMAHSLRERENTLKKEIKLLRIQVDQKRRQTQVEEITSSGFFRDLFEKVQQLKQRGLIS
jgi:CRP-like cAMP-binding protein